MKFLLELINQAIDHVTNVIKQVKNGTSHTFHLRSSLINNLIGENLIIILTNGSCSGHRDATFVLLSRTWSPERRRHAAQVNMQIHSRSRRCSLCTPVFTCQQPADRQVYGHLLLRHLVPECIYRVTGQTQADWLLTIRQTAVTLTECTQTFLIGLDQDVLLKITRKNHLTVQWIKY